MDPYPHPISTAPPTPPLRCRISLTLWPKRNSARPVACCEKWGPWGCPRNGWIIWWIYGICVTIWFKSGWCDLMCNDCGYCLVNAVKCMKTPVKFGSYTFKTTRMDGRMSVLLLSCFNYIFCWRYCMKDVLNCRTHTQHQSNKSVFGNKWSWGVPFVQKIF